MKSAQEYRRGWRLTTFFLFLALVAILFIGASETNLAILVGNHLGNIPENLNHVGQKD